MEEKVKAPFLKPALIYGAIMGVAGILLSVIFYVMDLQFATWTQILSLVITIALLVYCLRAYREEYMGGYASYGKLLLMTLGIAVVSTILSSIYTYLLVTVIDPAYLEKAMQFQIEKFSNNPRLGDAQLEMIIDRIENKVNVASTMRQIAIGGVVVTFILGLIVSAFVKKEENPVSDAM